MPIMCYWEEVGFRKGLQMGLTVRLKRMFGADEIHRLPPLEKIESVSALQSLCETLRPSITLADAHQLLTAAPAEH